jgi:RNA polymerase sigma-70 factor (ECF subfamily)
MATNPLKIGLNRKSDVSELSGFEFDIDLMTQAKSDPGVFTRLYLRHYDAVFGYCVHRLFDRHAAEDVTSQVFLSMVQGFGKFEGNERQFRNWLYRIATNAVNEHLRKTVRRNTILTWVLRRSGEEAGDCTQASEPADNQENLKKAMLTLKPKEQAIVTMRFFENLKTEEIAEVFGASAATIRSQLSRAIEKLRKHITYAQTDEREVTI